MRIVAILTRWIDVLAALLFGWREAWRARHSLIISRDEAGFLIRRTAAAGEETLALAAAGTPIAKDVADAARKSLVVLELPSDKAIARRISVPVKAREFLPGIIRNQIDRLSPWQADEAVYGFAADPSPEDAAALDVQVMVTSRAIVDAARAEIAALRLGLDRIVVRGSAAGPRIVLWTSLADGSRQGSDRARRLLAACIAGAVVISAGLSLWAFISAASIGGESEELAERIEHLERQLHAARGVTAAAARDPQEAAWIAKQTVPSAVVLLEALSRALPDSAYVTDLQLEGATLRVIGLAADAPSLIAPLEQSGHFTGVHFFGPTTRGADAGLYRFHIEAQVEPQLDVARD